MLADARKVMRLFSSDDDTWPLGAVLTWIATRSLKFTEVYAAREIHDADALLTLARGGSGTPPGVNYGEAFQALCQKIDAGEICGRATKLRWVVPPEQEHFTPAKYFSLAQPPERFEGCDFRPQELQNIYRAGDPTLRLNDFVFHDRDCLTPKGSGYGSPNPDGSGIRWSWQGATFARDDVLRLWPDLPCVTAWKKARARDWAPPKNLSPDWLNNLSPGQYVSIAEVVDLLAFGPDLVAFGLNVIEEMVARFCAGLALVQAAKNAKVTFCGHRTFRLAQYPGGLAPVSQLFKIDPESCVDLALVIDGPGDWLGPTRFADEYTVCGQDKESVTFVGVTAHRESLRRWLAELAGKPVPTKRGPRSKFDWGAIEGEAIRLMNQHGDFSSDKQNWNAQARLEDKLFEFCLDKFGREPGQTQMRKHVGGWLTLWRANRK